MNIKVSVAVGSSLLTESLLSLTNLCLFHQHSKSHCIGKALFSCAKVDPSYLCTTHPAFYSNVISALYFMVINVSYHLYFFVIQVHCQVDNSKIYMETKSIILFFHRYLFFSKLHRYHFWYPHVFFTQQLSKQNVD